MLQGVIGNDQVTMVDRVERTEKQADLHNQLKNS
jgi:hypothetical protein